MLICTWNWCAPAQNRAGKAAAVVMFQEIFLKPGMHFSLSGYSCFRKDTVDLRGVVAIAVKQAICCTVIHFETAR